MGELRALQHPDLPKLAELVERGGGDLRVLVLARDTDQLLHSTTVNRNFGDLTGQSSMLATNAAVIAAYVLVESQRETRATVHATVVLTLGSQHPPPGWLWWPGRRAPS